MDGKKRKKNSKKKMLTWKIKASFQNIHMVKYKWIGSLAK